MDSHKRNKYLLRGVLLLLLLLAIAGPWLYTRDGVPPPAWCRPPNFLLTPERCVRHQSGAEVLLWSLVGPAAFASDLLSGNLTVAELVVQALYRTWLLLIWLPVPSTLLLWLRGQEANNQKQRRAHIVALALGLLATIPLALFDGIVWPGWRAALWGIWLYVLLLAAALLWELRGVRLRPTPAEGRLREAA